MSENISPKLQCSICEETADYIVCHPLIMDRHYCGNHLWLSGQQMDIDLMTSARHINTNFLLGTTLEAEG